MDKKKEKSELDRSELIMKILERMDELSVEDCEILTEMAKRLVNTESL